MTPDEYEQQRFYHRANNAMDAAEAVVCWRLAQELLPKRDPNKPPMPSPLKAWFGTMAAFLGLAAVTFFIEAGSRSTEDFIKDQNSPSHVWSIIFLVPAVLCFFGAIIHAAWHDWSVRNDPPAAPAAPVLPQQPTPPVGPAPTQTRVERSVRVVRATSATTTHQDSTTPVAAIEAPHKDVEQSTDLVVVRQSPRRIIWTEDHGTYRTVDRRSFDRDIGPV